MLERLNQLDTNLNELLKFKRSVALSHIKKDLQKQWILWYGLFESIQIVIHIACHLTAKYHLGNPETYTDCVQFLADHNYISHSLAAKLTGMVGLRNILLHEYVSIDIEKLYSLLDELDDFVLFANKVKDVI